MGKIGLLKRGCLAFGLLFGCVFGLGYEGAEAQMSGITEDGCYFARVGSGDFNSNPTGVEFAPTNQPWCATSGPQPLLQINDTNPGFGSASGWGAPAYGVVYTPADVTLATGCKMFYERTNDNPTIDQGVIDFDNNEPDDEYRTCLDIVSGGGVNEIRYDITGWAWNTNIGWFSMTGKDDGNGGLENEGIDYGNAADAFASEIRMDTSTGTGELYGFWWNDVAGWLKLNCAGDTALNASDSDNCAVDGGANYGVSVVGFDATSGRALLSGSAWSDTVGYIDFQGVEVELPALSVDYTPEVRYVPIDADNDGVIRAASGDGYKIEIRFKNGLVNMTEEFANPEYQNSFCLSYSDLRLLDELTGRRVSSSDGRPLNYSCNTSSSGVEDRYALEDDIDMNNVGWDEANDGVIMTGVNNRFAYDTNKKAFVYTDVVRSRISTEGQRIRLNNIFVRNGISGSFKSLFANDYDLVGALEFAAPYDVSILGGEVSDVSQCVDGELTIDFANPIQVSFCGTLYNRSGFIQTLNAGILGLPTVNDAYADQFGSVTATLDQDGNNTFKSLNLVTSKRAEEIFGSSDFWLNLNLANGVEPSDLEPVKSLLNLSISSVVNYTLASTGAVVKRVGPELSDDSQNIFELNIQGGLIDRSFGSSTFSTGSKDTLGVSEGVKVKERVYRVLRNILALKPGSCGNLSIEGVDRIKLRKSILAGCERVSQSGGRNVVYIGSSGRSRVGEYIAYSEMTELIQKQTINGKAPVIVLYGVDLILDVNNYGDALAKSIETGSFSNLNESVIDQVPGLVVVENSDLMEGGEVIVSAEDVTDFVGYIYADGRMMSAPDASTSAVAAQGDADVVLNRGAISKENLYNQFSFFGALYTSNCIGCASNSPALRADGSVAESRNLSLNDDLNAFRYTPLRFRVESGSYEFDTGFGVSEVEYSCYVPCDVGYDAGDVDDWVDSELFTTRVNDEGKEVREFNQSACNGFNGSLDVSDACYDVERYTTGVNRLSQIEESLAEATLLEEGVKVSGGLPFQLEVSEQLEGGDYSSVRSVNIRPLEVQSDMPVFGAISE